MSRRNDPAPIIAAGAMVNDACDWLSEILQGGLNKDLNEIAVELAQERFLDAQQILVEAAYTTEPIGTETINGHEFVEYREVVANRLALKALELFNWRVETLMESMESHSILPRVIDKKWIAGTRNLLPEFCSHGFAAPVKREHLSNQKTAAGTGFIKWLFARTDLAGGHV